MFLGWYVMTRACRSAAVRLLPGVVTNPLSVLLPHEVVLFVVRSWGYPRTGKSRQMWPHCGVLSQHPLFDVAKEGRSISALFFFPLQRHLLACNDHTYVLRVSDSWAMRTRVLVGKSLSFHTGNDGIMWFHVHGRHQAVAPIAACRKEFSIFNSFVVFFTQLSCPRMKGAITLSRYNYI